MKNTMWSKLINEKREELSIAISEQYSAAVNGNMSLNYVVLLHNDGEVVESHRTQNSWSMAEHNNETILVYSVQGFYLEVDELELLRNDKEVAMQVLEKYNELQVDEEDHIASVKDIDDLHGLLQGHFEEWLEECIDCIVDDEIANLDTYDIIDRKITEEEASENYRD